jgi:hypothetical protein
MVIQNSDSNYGLKMFKHYDSVLSFGESLRYDIYNRPRRQDFLGTMIEIGAFHFE